MGILVIADIIEDYSEGAQLTHLIVEGLLFVLSISIFLLVLKNWLKERQRAESLASSVSNLKMERDQLQLELQKHLQGLALVIEKQYEAWGLTQSEKEVGFLLLKGFSIKEVASLRGTSEKTVQVQAQSIYKKSNLHNRSEFAAYFLEDLLPPQYNNPVSMRNHRLAGGRKNVPTINVLK
jgi:DNA-binding CsgD family transcriptional regulator